MCSNTPTLWSPRHTHFYFLPFTSDLLSFSLSFSFPPLPSFSSSSLTLYPSFCPFVFFSFHSFLFSLYLFYFLSFFSRLPCPYFHLLLLFLFLLHPSFPYFLTPPPPLTFAPPPSRVWLTGHLVFISSLCDWQALVMTHFLFGNNYQPAPSVPISPLCVSVCVWWVKAVFCPQSLQRPSSSGHHSDVLWRLQLLVSLLSLVLGTRIFRFCPKQVPGSGLRLLVSLYERLSSSETCPWTWADFTSQII